MENKTERFTRIAEKRTNNILEQIRLLGNCANRNNYSYDEEDVKKIFSVIEHELKNTKIKFRLDKGKGKFKL